MTVVVPAYAFELYVGLGSRRSYEAVAAHLDVKTSVIERIAAVESWDKRIQEMTARSKGVSIDAFLDRAIEAVQDDGWARPDPELLG